MTIRKTLFWLHLVAGCVAGAIILVMSLTGVLLTYERQILAWSARGGIVTAPSAGGPRLAAGELVERVRQQRGELTEGAMLTMRSDPREPAEIRAGREAPLYVNPYSGAIVQGGSGTVRTFFQKMTAWHRWLGVEGPGRATAKAITGACNLAFLVLIVSGAYLWLPRQWSWQAVRAITLFRGGLSGKARDFNWHNVFGIWMLAPLFLVVVTALPMSYGWANDLVYRMTGSEPPQGPGSPKGGGGKGAEKGTSKRTEGRPDRAERGERRERAAGLPAAELNRLWSLAARQVPGWTSISARAVATAGSAVSFTIDTGDGGQPQKRSTVVLDAASGAVVRRESFGDLSAGRRLRMWTRFVHTGEYYGLVGQTLAGLASVAGVMLVWTGIALAWRRWTAWQGRRRRAVREEVVSNQA